MNVPTTVTSMIAQMIDEYVDVNPGTIILGGYFATVAAYDVPTAMRELRARAIAGDAAMCRITASAYGFSSAVRGGASVIVEQVFQDPVRVRAATDIEAAAAGRNT